MERVGAGGEGLVGLAVDAELLEGGAEAAEQAVGLRVPKTCATWAKTWRSAAERWWALQGSHQPPTGSLGPAPVWVETLGSTMPVLSRSD